MRSRSKNAALGPRADHLPVLGHLLGPRPIPSAGLRCTRELGTATPRAATPEPAGRRTAAASAAARPRRRAPRAARPGRRRRRRRRVGGGRAGDDEDVLAARLAEVDVAERRPHDRLVQLGQLARRRDRAVGARAPRRGRRACARPGAAPRRGRSCAARRPARRAARRGPPGPRQEALEDEAARRQPARHERGDHRRRPGHRRHLVAGVERGAHEPLAGVADAGRAGVGDDGDVAAVAEHVEHLADAGRPRCARCRPPGGRRGRRRAAAGGPCAGCPRSRSASASASALDGPWRQVAEVADRRGDEDQRPARS